jgi:hypothetical protein
MDDRSGLRQMHAQCPGVVCSAIGSFDGLALAGEDERGELGRLDSIEFNAYLCRNIGKRVYRLVRMQIALRPLHGLLRRFHNIAFDCFSANLDRDGWSPYVMICCPNKVLSFSASSARPRYPSTTQGFPPAAWGTGRTRIHSLRCA